MKTVESKESHDVMEVDCPAKIPEEEMDVEFLMTLDPLEKVNTWESTRLGMKHLYCVALRRGERQGKLVQIDIV